MIGVYFGFGTKYDDGFWPSIALNERGLIVEVHQKDLELCYRVGRLQLDLNVLPLSGPAARYDDGITPAIAIDNDGLVVEVHANSSASLFYRVGKISGNYTIEWLTGAERIGDIQGRTPKVALCQNKIGGKKLLVEAHVEQSSEELFCLIGEVADSGAIGWSNPQSLGPGSSPALAVGPAENGFRVVEVHQSSKKLLYRMGALALEAASPRISWDQGPEEYGRGYWPSVTMGERFVFEVHETADWGSYSLYSQVGELQSESIQWREASYFDTGLKPTVSCNAGFAIQAHSNQKSTELYWSACMVTDRSKWIGDQLERLKDRRLDRLIQQYYRFCNFKSEQYKHSDFVFHFC